MSEVLPEGWLALKLGDVIDYGKTQKIDPANISNETWVLELEDIEKDTSRLVSRVRFLERQSKSTKNKFNKGDVLYGKLRPYLNKVLIADESGVCTTEIVPIYKSPFLDSSFVFYWLKSSFFINYVSGVVYGLNMPRLGTKEGLNAPFLLPPLAEQQEIATRLDALLAQVDTIKARLDALPAILKRFRQAVLAAAVSGKLTEDWRCLTPIGLWEQKQLSDVVKEKPRNGYSPQSVDYQTKFKNLTLSSITQGKFIEGKFKYIDIDIEASSYLWVKNEDILIQRANSLEYVGVSAIYKGKDDQYVYPDLIMKCRANACILTDYLHFCLLSNSTREYFRKNATGTAGNMPKINQKVVCATTIPLPPLPEQTEIVNRIEQLFAFADQIEHQVQTAQTRVNQLTQAILAKAFKGELTADWRSAHPELISGEHSAEALLEKIKATQIPNKPKRGKAKQAEFNL